MLNRSSRQFQILVGALDVTSLVQYFEVGDDRISSSGLIATRGTIKLGYNPKFNIGRDPKISLDPKIPDSASYWSRGVSVKLWLNDSTQTLRPHPRHSLRILSTTFNRDELSLVIEVGCLIALLDSQQPEGDESDVCVNERKSVDDIIESLLIGGAKDYPSVSINYIGLIPGFIESPQEKGSGGSYIGEAGKIAYGRGYALWTTKDEAIKAIKIVPENSLARIVLDADRDTLTYTRNDGQGSSAETPYDRVRVRYTVVTIKETELGFTQTTEEFGVTEFSGSSDVVIRRTQITDELDFDEAKRTVTTVKHYRRSEIFPWAYSSEPDADNPVDRLIRGEEHVEVFNYEKSLSDDLTEACSDESSIDLQGRLLSKSITIRRARGWIFAEWIEQHELINTIPLKIKVENNLGIGGGGYLIFDTNPIVRYKTEKITYTFLTENPDSKTIKTERRIHKAVIFPKAWKYTRRSPNVPNGLVDGGGLTESWTRRLGSQEWQRQTTERTPLGLAFRSVCDARFKKAISTDYSGNIDPESNRQLSISNVRRFSEQITTIRNEITVSSTQTTPPSPEFIPERYSRTEEEQVIEFPINSQFATGGTGKVKEIILDAPIERSANPGQSPINSIEGLPGVGLRGMQDDLAQAKTQAKVEALLVWGRFRSISMTYELRDIWFEVSQLPLLRFDVLDRDRITDTVYRHSYLVDGWTNAVTLRECLCSHDGLWQGSALEITQELIRVAAAIEPNSTYLQVEPLTYAVQEGDPIVIDVTASLLADTSAQESAVLNLLNPLVSQLDAGTTFLLNGFTYELAVTATIGATSLVLTSPLQSPIAANAVLTVGTLATSTAYAPVGSTAIYVVPTTNTGTITPSTVTIDVEAIVPPASLPITGDIDVVIRVEPTVTQKLEPAIGDVQVVIRTPDPGNYENIGNVYGQVDVVIETEPIIKRTAIGDVDVIIDIDGKASVTGDVQVIIEVEPIVTPLASGDVDVVIEVEPTVSNPSVLGSISVVIEVEPIVIPYVVGDVDVVIEVNPIAAGELTGSFEIIAVW